jgi:hypothetical protein
MNSRWKMEDCRDKRLCDEARIGKRDRVKSETRRTKTGREKIGGVKEKDVREMDIGGTDLQEVKEGNNDRDKRSYKIE